MAEALATDRGALLAHPEWELSGDAGHRAAELIDRREAREPVAYLLGRRGFRRLDIAVDGRVYIPRPETELLVEVALELPRGARVHEVATGSGAVALALLDERPDLRVSASDASEGAVEVARANAARFGLPLDVELARGLPPAARAVDLVVSNPPYLREDERGTLAPELADFEPAEALFAGAAGLDVIEAIVAAAAPGTRVAFEHAFDQGPAVRALLMDAATRRDLAGHERVTLGHTPGGTAAA